MFVMPRLRLVALLRPAGRRERGGHVEPTGTDWATALRAEFVITTTTSVHLHHDPPTPGLVSVTLGGQPLLSDRERVLIPGLTSCYRYCNERYRAGWRRWWKGF